MVLTAVEADFNTTSFQVVFPADENRDPISSIPVELNIIDDEINERFQQVFLIGAEVLSAVNPSTIDNTERNVTMGIVLDDDGKSLKMVSKFSMSLLSCSVGLAH